MGKRITITCERCSKPFEADLWRTLETTEKRYRRRFCSIKCGTNRHPPAEIRFFKMVEKQANGCWRWTGNVNNYDYPQFWEHGENIQAHRWAFMHWKGPIPEGKILRHTCDVTRCVNPEHLIPGTNKENSEDAVARNRTARQGGQLPNDKRVALMHLLKTDMTQVQIARATGISIKTVQRHGLERTQHIVEPEKK